MTNPRPTSAKASDMGMGMFIGVFNTDRHRRQLSFWQIVASDQTDAPPDSVLLAAVGLTGRW